PLLRPLLPTTSSLLPYTTLFRSDRESFRTLSAALGRVDVRDRRHHPQRPARPGAGTERRSPHRTRPPGTWIPVPPPPTTTTGPTDRKSTRLNSSHVKISYAVFCL